MPPPPRDDRPPASDVLDGRYTLLERIGRGGMAEVFRARDERLGREVAVKLLAPHLFQDAVAARQLVREARAAASVRHPGIVGVYDTGSDGDTHYLVMELVEGRTLGDVLAAGGALAPEEAVRVATEVADAVQAAHERGIVHRDLKPSNVLFDVDGRVRVTDFGIAHAATATATATAMMAGSAPYLSPEQAAGEDPRPTADVYALGCLLFEMATGRPPFEGPTAVAVLAAHLHRDPVAPSSLRPDVPAVVDAVVLRAMAKDPAERQPDAGAFARELQGLDAAATLALPPAIPVDAPEPAPTVAMAGTAPAAAAGTSPGAEPAERRPWLWAVAGATAVVLLAIVIGALAGGGPGDEVPGILPVPGASPTAAGPPPPPSPSPPLSPSPSPSLSPAPPPAPTTPAEAAAAVRERLEEGRRAFEIDDDDAEDIDDRLAEIVREHRKGPNGPDKAREKLEELRKKVDELAEKGDVGAELHADLQRGLDDLAATL